MPAPRATNRALPPPITLSTLSSAIFAIKGVGPGTINCFSGYLYFTGKMVPSARSMVAPCWRMEG